MKKLLLSVLALALISFSFAGCAKHHGADHPTGSDHPAKDHKSSDHPEKNQKSSDHPEKTQKTSEQPTSDHPE